MQTKEVYRRFFVRTRDNPMPVYLGYQVYHCAKVAEWNDSRDLWQVTWVFQKPSGNSKLRRWSDTYHHTHHRLFYSEPDMLRYIDRTLRYIRFMLPVHYVGKVPNNNPIYELPTIYTIPKMGRKQRIDMGIEAAPVKERQEVAQ